LSTTKEILAGIAATDPSFIVLNYIDNGGNWQSYGYDVLSIQGADDVDDLNTFPDNGLIRLLNGDYFSQPINSFNRRISVDFGIVDDPILRIFISDFLFTKNKKTVIAGSEEIEIVFENPSKLQNEWIDACVYQKRYRLTMMERYSINALPWLSYRKLPVILSDGTSSFIPLNADNKLIVTLAGGTMAGISVNGSLAVPVTLANGSGSQIATVAP